MKKKHVQMISNLPRHRTYIRPHCYLENSIREIMKCERERLVELFHIVTVGQKSIDHGGVSRLFLMNISSYLTDAALGYFRITENNTLVVKPKSHRIPNHKIVFRFAGHLLAKALLDQYQHLFVFAPYMYRYLQSYAVRLENMRGVDTDMYQGLQAVLDEDYTGDRPG
jgi:E3 ubiquitin-protein ligase HUWE1